MAIRLLFTLIAALDLLKHARSQGFEFSVNAGDLLDHLLAESTCGQDASLRENLVITNLSVYNGTTDGNVYNVTTDGNVYNGTTDGNVYNVTTDGNVYNGTTDGNVYNGTTDGNVYNGTTDGNVYNETNQTDGFEKNKTETISGKPRPMVHVKVSSISSNEENQTGNENAFRIDFHSENEAEIQLLFETIVGAIQISPLTQNFAFLREEITQIEGGHLEKAPEPLVTIEEMTLIHIEKLEGILGLREMLPISLPKGMTLKDFVKKMILFLKKASGQESLGIYDRNMTYRENVAKLLEKIDDDNFKGVSLQGDGTPITETIMGVIGRLEEVSQLQQ